MPDTFSYLIGVISRTLAVYRAHFVRLVVFSAIVIVPITLLTALIQSAVRSTIFISSWGDVLLFGDLVLALIGGLVRIIASLLIYMLINGVITCITADHIDGVEVTISAPLEAVWSRLRPWIISLIYAYIIILVLGLVVGVLMQITPLLSIVGAVVIYVGITLTSLLPAVMLLEQHNARAGLARAYEMARVRFWTLFGVIAVLFILSMALTIIVGIIGLALAPPDLSAPSAGLSGVMEILNPALNLRVLIISLVVNVLLAPLLPIAMMLLYDDTRAQRPLAEAHATHDATVIADASFVADTPMVAAPRALFTRQDAVNMAVLTLLALIYTLATEDSVLSLLGGGLSLALR